MSFNFFTSKYNSYLCIHGIAMNYVCVCIYVIDILRIRSNCEEFERFLAKCLANRAPDENCTFITHVAVEDSNRE